MKRSALAAAVRSRRDFFKLSASAALAAGATPLLAAAADEACTPNVFDRPFNGSSCPFPIPWLDKNGSHNQAPKAGSEPSNIFHFKGQVARCNDWVGMGTDNRGNRLAFGSPSTDFSFMKGTYFAGRSEHQGIFSHI